MSQTSDEQAQYELLRGNLDSYDLSEEDFAVLSGEYSEYASQRGRALPVVAIVGRPNVG